jgi:OmpA family
MFWQKQEEDHSHWISFTDLVLGFMIVFIVISLVALFQLKPCPACPVCPTCPPPCPGPETSTSGKYSELVGIFRSRLNGINDVEIADSATIRFSIRHGSNYELFHEAEDRPTTYFKSILDEFLPIYFEEMSKLYKDQKAGKFSIREIRIEGHTDSKGPYMYNLKLSSNRALRVQQYLLMHSAIHKYGNDFSRFMEKNSLACGYSFSRRLDKKGNIIENTSQTEDFDKSRRVEFRILLEYKKP